MFSASGIIRRGAFYADWILTADGIALSAVIEFAHVCRGRCRVFDFLPSWRCFLDGVFLSWRRFQNYSAVYRVLCRYNRSAGADIILLQSRRTFAEFVWILLKTATLPRYKLQNTCSAKKIEALLCVRLFYGAISLGENGFLSAFAFVSDFANWFADSAQIKSRHTYSLRPGVLAWNCPKNPIPHTEAHRIFAFCRQNAPISPDARRNFAPSRKILTQEIVKIAPFPSK